MPPKIYYSDADKQRDTAKQANGSAAKPKALKASSSKAKSVIQAFKPKIAATSNNSNKQQKAVNKAVITAAMRGTLKNRLNTANSNSSRPNSAQQQSRQQQQVRQPQQKAKPAQQQQQQQRISVSAKLENALQTAQAVIRNKNHKNNAEVKQLIDSFKKQWVTEKRFLELLPKLLFE